MKVRITGKNPLPVQEILKPLDPTQEMIDKILGYTKTVPFEIEFETDPELMPFQVRAALKHLRRIAPREVGIKLFGDNETVTF